MALHWYPVHVDRIFGSSRWRSVSGNAKGLWSNLMHLAWTTAEGRRTGRLVRGNGAPITVSDIREEFNYRRHQQVSRLLQALLDVGLVAEDAGILYLPRFASLVRARARESSNVPAQVPAHVPAQVPARDRPKSKRQGVRSASRSPTPTTTPTVCKHTIPAGTNGEAGRRRGARNGVSRETLNGMVQEDLEDLARLRKLRARAPDGFPAGEHGDLLWISCAVHALRVGRNPCALFRCLVDPARVGWATVAAKDEEAARDWIRKEEG